MEFVVDPLPNSWNLHHKNCMAENKETDSKEIY